MKINLTKDTTLSPFETLKTIVVSNDGFVTQKDVEVLAEHFPDLVIVAKMGYGLRFASPATHFKNALENNIKYHLDVYNVDQYVRDVFISADDCDRIVALFRWEKEMPKY